MSDGIERSEREAVAVAIYTLLGFARNAPGGLLGHWSTSVVCERFPEHMDDASYLLLRVGPRFVQVKVYSLCKEGDE